MSKVVYIGCVVMGLILLPYYKLDVMARDLPAQLPKPENAPQVSDKPVKVYILSGQSNMVGMGKIAGEKPGTLQTVVKKDKKFQHLITEDGKWTQRKDTFFVDLSNRRIAKWLTVGVMGRTIGPEVQFGHILGYYHDEMVLVIKAAQGNRSISHDVMPPSSRTGAPRQGKFYKGWQYDAFIADIHKILDNLPEYFPVYEGQGYEIAGFGWWQGHKDGGLSQRHYERHLVNLINDLRAEFKAPKAPFVVGTVGFGGKSMGKKYKEIWKAQMAVSDPDKYPDFAGNVKTVDTCPFWRSPANSPTDAGYHYNGNAETYMLVGDAMGRAMVEMRQHENPEQVVSPESD